MRSKLFVPGSRPALFEKAYRSAADAVSLDLEDAVAPEAKAQARAQICAWLDQADAALRHSKTTVVRINATDSPWFADDLEAMVREEVDIINLPKPASAASVAEVGARIRQLESARGLSHPVGLLLNIETPSAVREALELARADTHVIGLQLGFADLFEPFGIDRSEKSAYAHVLLRIKLAAAEAGIAVYDGAFANINDPDGFTEEARLAQRLGYGGKTCIHPSQIPLANAVFSPSTEAIAHARAVVQAAKDAAQRSDGVYVVDGKMVDAPFVMRAQALLEQATRLGLVP